MSGLNRIIWGNSFLLLLLGLTLAPLVAEEFRYARAAVVTKEGVSIPVEVSDTPVKRGLGLGKRDALREGWGMLFVFERRILHRFWMKDMRFPIDIIWLDNHRIVEIVERVLPPDADSKARVLEPRQPSNFVLELEAGRAEALGLSVGQILRYQF